RARMTSASIGRAIAGRFPRTSASRASVRERGAISASMTTAEAARLAASWRAAGKTVVFTNGVFDLLHPGHVRYLQQARALGDALLVGTTSNRPARVNKEPGRPIPPEAERAEIVEALACVDAVVIFDEDTPHQLIAAIQPDVLVKGADWPADGIV